MVVTVPHHSEELLLFPTRMPYGHQLEFYCFITAFSKSYIYFFYFHCPFQGLLETNLSVYGWGYRHVTQVQMTRPILLAIKHFCLNMNQTLVSDSRGHLEWEIFPHPNSFTMQVYLYSHLKCFELKDAAFFRSHSFSWQDTVDFLQMGVSGVPLCQTLITIQAYIGLLNCDNSLVKRDVSVASLS